MAATPITVPRRALLLVTPFRKPSVNVQQHRPMATMATLRVMLSTVGMVVA